MAKIENLPNICEALACWLEYQSLCGRGFLISKSYLSHPISEFLQIRHNGDIIPDFDIPIPPEKENINRGRPRQLDFALLTPQSKDIDSAIEVIFVKNNSLSSQKVFDTIMRLERLRDFGASNTNVDRFLLVCGQKTDFEDRFKNIRMNVGEDREFFTQQLLSFDNKNPMTVELEGDIERFRQIFSEEYAEFVLNIPNTFITTLLNSYSSSNYTAFLWKIQSSQGRN